jgi:FkbM family methyltransferase
MSAWRRALFSSLLSRSAPGLFVDVGANIGQSARDYLAVMPNGAYIGFEPGCAAAWCATKYLQLRSAGDAIVLPIALWSSVVTAELLTRPLRLVDPAGSILEGIRPGRAYKRVPVLCVPFDVVWEARGSASVALVKVDVEGSELEVLLGMQKSIGRWRPPIVCEVLRPDIQADRDDAVRRLQGLESLLERMQYSAYGVQRSARGASLVMTPVEKFPCEYWRRTDRSRCDYLFMPLERAVEELPFAPSNAS